MNFFEDLIVELKEENLLEDTVIELAQQDNAAANGIYKSEPALDSVTPDSSLVMPTNEAEDSVVRDEMVESDQADTMPLVVPEDSEMLLQGSDEKVSIAKPKADREFYIKRATAEVSSLQMVEHVFSAVEREYQKKLPIAFDDLSVKKALNAFVMVTGEVTSEEHKSAEFTLMQETEAWCSALAERDRLISVADLRRYCENCRPMLSSQAMLSLARFYRNLPYSEPVRGKFDFIITRLFSKPVEDQSRKLLFTASEMLGHVQKLYADWSSLSLFSVDDPESNIKLAVLSFGDLTAEAEKAIEFDELIKSDFFDRLRMFKESIADLFYSPEVTVSAIECNVRVGNVYVELIDRERRRSSAANVHDKYSYVDGDTVSEATGRTLNMSEVLRGSSNNDETPAINEPIVDEPEDDTTQTVAKKVVQKDRPRRISLPKVGLDKLGVNKWLLISGAILITLSLGLYVWANFFVSEPPSTAGVANYDLTSSPFREDLKLAKVSGETFYGVLQPSWETMPKERQQELVQKIYKQGAGKDWLKVNLMNSQGKTVAFMSSTRLDINPAAP